MEKGHALGTAAPEFPCAELYPEAHHVLRVLGSRVAPKGYTRMGTSDACHHTGLTHEQVRAALDDLFGWGHLRKHEERWYIPVLCTCERLPKLERVLVFDSLVSSKLDSSAATGSPFGGTSVAQDRDPAPPCEENPREARPRRPRRENSRSLAYYFQRRLLEAGEFSSGGFSLSPLENNMARWRKEGHSLEEIRATVDAFFDLHPDLVKDQRPTWKLYILNIRRLWREAEHQQRSERMFKEKTGDLRTDYLVGLSSHERTMAQMERFLGKRMPVEEADALT